MVEQETKAAGIDPALEWHVEGLERMLSELEMEKLLGRLLALGPEMCAAGASR